MPAGKGNPPEVSECPFCTLPNVRIKVQNHLAVAIDDYYPVTPGHALVIPKRHVADYWGLSILNCTEQQDCDVEMVAANL
jgi:diadenosine tetraphosphate (Ap4A) HIT family hydrolase